MGAAAMSASVPPSLFTAPENDAEAHASSSQAGKEEEEGLSAAVTM